MALYFYQFRDLEGYWYTNIFKSKQEAIKDRNNRLGNKNYPKVLTVRTKHSVNIIISSSKIRPHL